MSNPTSYWLEPSASQAPSSSQRSLPQIFLDEAGSPLNVFVESNGVSENRPRLIRTLRNHGARISSDVSQAHIILVEPNSSEGRQFVRDWSEDSGKVVLEISWIRRCTEAGRALLAKDAWGGCGNLDGAPLPGDREDEDTDSRPLPKKAMPQKNSTPRTVRSSAPFESSHTPLPTPQQLHTTTIPENNHSQANMNWYPAQHHSAPKAVSSSYSPHSQLPLTYDAHAQSTHQIPMQHHNALVPQYSQVVPNQSHALTIARAPHFTAEAVAAYVAENPEFMNILFNKIAQRNNAPQAQSSHAQSWPVGFNPQVHNFEANVSQGSLGNTSYVDPGVATGHVGTMQPSYEQSTRSQLHHAIKHEEEEMPTSRNGYNISSTLPDSQNPASQVLIRERHDSPNSSTVNTKKRLHEVYDHSASPSSSRNSDANNRNGSKKQKLPSVADKPAGIFTSDTGEPYNFFVQVQVRNRIDLVKQIKKNGGQICFEPSEADFIILVPQPDKMSEQWMKSVNDLQRYALRPAFVETCLEEGRLVGEEEFLLVTGAGATPKKKGKSRAEPSIKTEAMDNEGHGGVKSPTPPPPESTRGRGRVAYTNEEKAYARKYAAHAFRQRPNMSWNDLGEELSQRVPRHTSAGWAAHLHSFSAEFEDIRAKARGGADRSPSKSVESEDVDSVHLGSESAHAEVEKELQPPSADESIETKPPIEPVAESIVDKLDASLKNFLEEDFITIINYFCDPPDGMEDDDQLWADLAKKHICRTAPSWQEFYQNHNKDVNDRLIKALNQKEAVA